jgi:SOS response regulatory protein OraA/RecX
MNIQLRLSNYISRYAPSRKKVTGYLLKKKIENTVELLSEMGYDEGLMCDMWLRSFISLGKGQREIQQKLLKKEFPKEMIQEKISLLEDEISDWDSYKIQIEHQIHTLLERGKSLRVIQNLLVSRYPYFRDEIVWYIENATDMD